MKSYVAIPALIVGCAGTLAANAITMQTPFAFRSDRTANSLGLLQSSIVIGVNGVTPNSLDGGIGLQTTVTATQDGTTVALGKINAAVGTPFRNSYIAQIAYDADLTGAWSVTATNTATTPASLTLNTVAFGDVASVPFVASMSLSGTGTDLNLNWVQPATTDRIDRQTIFVYEQQAGGAYQLVFSQELGTTARAFNLGSIAITAGVEIGTNYVISIDTSDNAPAGNTIASSASYFNFTPTPEPIEAYLPSSGAPGVSEYNVRVVGGEPVSLITQGGAVGYDFVTHDGDPMFRSIQLPTSIGELFDLWLFDDEGAAFFVRQIGNDVYNFGGDGVSAFRLFTTGIGSGPTSTTDFSIAPELTFMSRGTFTGSISALATDPRPPTSVPEPATLGLLGAGLALLALRRRKQHA